MRLLLTILLFPILNFAVSAQEETRKLTVRTLCLKQVDGLKKIQYIGPGKGDAPIDIPLWTNEPSDDIVITVKGPKANFVIMEKNKAGEDVPRLVASGFIAKASRQLFFFLPSGKKDEPYILRAFDDDTKSFPLGGIRIINLSPTRALFELGEIKKVLKSNDFTIVAKPKKVNKFNDYNFQIQLEREDGKLHDVCQRRLKAVDTKRDIAVVYLDPVGKRVIANIYPDIPLWLP